MADTGVAPMGNVITSGRPIPTILKLALPTVAAMVSQAFVNGVDTLFCGRLPPGESSNAQGALFPSMVLLWAFGGSLSAIGVGTQALTARRFAEKSDAEIGKVVINAVLFAAVGSLVFTVIGYAILDWALANIIRGDDVEGARIAAHGYMSFRLFGIASMALTAPFKAFFDGIGKTYVHFVAAIVMNAINVVCCWLFIFGRPELGIPHMGIRGAGLGAVISTWVGLGIMIAFALRAKNRKRFRPFRLSGYDPKLLWQVLKLSIPGGVATIAVMTGFILFASIAARLDDLHPVLVMGEMGKETVSMAATNNIVGVLHLTFTACLGFGTATATLVSQCLGEKDGEKAARFGWSSVRLGLVIFGVIGALEAIFARQIVGFVSKDPLVQQAALLPMQMMASVTPLIATGMILTQALFGAGNTKFVMVVELILHFFCLVPLAYILGVKLDLGIVGLWSAAIAYIVLLAAAMILKFRQGTWKNIRL